MYIQINEQRIAYGIPSKSMIPNADTNASSVLTKPKVKLNFKLKRVVNS